MPSCRRCRSPRGGSCPPCRRSSEALCGVAHQMGWWAYLPVLTFSQSTALSRTKAELVFLKNADAVPVQLWVAM